MFLRVHAADGLQRTLVSAEREGTAAMAAGAVTSLMFSLAVERLILPQGHLAFTLTALSFHMKMQSSGAFCCRSTGIFTTSQPHRGFHRE